MNKLKGQEKMNLPNKLTTTRLVIAPFIALWFFSIEFINNLSVLLYSIVLIILYGVMEITDLLDGKIARKRNLVTDLGKVFDPFGDTISHLTFFTCFLVCKIMPVWAYLIILWREFSQSFVRMLVMGKARPMAANIYGKIKTCSYALCAICGFASRIIILCDSYKGWMQTVMNCLFAIAALFSIISFLIYIRRIKEEGTLSSMTR